VNRGKIAFNVECLLPNQELPVSSLALGDFAGLLAR